MGLARVLTGSSLLSRGSRGTYHWAAPELLLGRRVTIKADIWSFGVVSTCRHMLLRLHWLVSVMPDCCCTAIVIPRSMFGVQAAVSDSRCIAAVARLMLMSMSMPWLQVLWELFTAEHPKRGHLRPLRYAALSAQLTG